MHTKEVILSGQKPESAKKALIMLHGRGASANDILGLAPYLSVQEYLLVAPQATNHTWYPYSFLAPPEQNEPWLSSALTLLDEVVQDVKKYQIRAENMYFLGFSQGACLTLEYVTRKAQKWGGVVALIGGLIGDKIYVDNYKGNFEGTPIYISARTADPHVPLERAQATARILESMYASVTEKVYNIGHTVGSDEIRDANQLIFKS